MSSKTKSKLQLNPISRDKVNLNSQTITTARCVSLQPVCVHEVVAGDSFNVRMQQFNRVDALPVSSFIQFKNRNAAFYVRIVKYGNLMMLLRQVHLMLLVIRILFLRRNRICMKLICFISLLCNMVLFCVLQI